MSADINNREFRKQKLKEIIKKLCKRYYKSEPREAKTLN